MRVVEIDNVSFLRNERAILKDVTWAIESGQHWALLGANASGKTTLLKIMTGYEWVTSGSVALLGERFGQCDMRECRKRIGWVSSSLEHRLPGRDSALEIVLSGLEASMGLFREFAAEEIARAEHAMAMLNCGELAGQRYGILSQGEQQRVIIARALVCQPGVLLLDEPCAGLDPGARQQFLDDLARLAARDDAPTMVLVTHHIEEIGPWIGHVMLLKEGQCLAAGGKNEVLKSDTLSEAFSCRCRVERRGEYYCLRLA